MPTIIVKFLIIKRWYQIRDTYFKEVALGCKYYAKMLNKLKAEETVANLK